ncbi:MAG: hypothetical protein M3320_07430, partial [Actinomycetota bacterium]|nr:hypothetical protein [Actinomycetota bacterium]
MLEAVSIVSLALAALCVLAALSPRIPLPPRVRKGLDSGHPRGRSPEERTAAFVVALLLVILAATTAAIDEKVADKGGGAESADRAPPAASADTSWPIQHLDAFRAHPEVVSGPVTRQHCLVRYYKRGREGGPGANWWTTCEQNSVFATLDDVRRELALPHDWGPYDARVVARIPVGEDVVFVRGRAARQCENDGKPCYEGGGTQLLFREADFDDDWFVRFDCAPRDQRSPR